MTPKTAKHIAFCLVCCGGGKNLTQPTSKKNAEKAATGHMNAYGHAVTVLDAK